MKWSFQKVPVRSLQVGLYTFGGFVFQLSINPTQKTKGRKLFLLAKRSLRLRTVEERLVANQLPERLNKKEE